jgi:hypothetical protein
MGEPPFFELTVHGRQNHSQVRRKLRQHLPTCATWTNRLRGLRDNNDRRESAHPFGNRLTDRHPLGTHRKPATDVFDVATREQPTVFGNQSSSDSKIGFFRISEFPGRFCCVYPFSHTISQILSSPLPMHMRRAHCGPLDILCLMIGGGRYSAALQLVMALA